MSEHLSDDARREAARKRLQERQAREQAENAGQSTGKANKAKPFARAAAKPAENAAAAGRPAKADAFQREAAPKQRITREEAHGKAPSKHHPLSSPSANRAKANTISPNRRSRTAASVRNQATSANDNPAAAEAGSAKAMRSANATRAQRQPETAQRPAGMSARKASMAEGSEGGFPKRSASNGKASAAASAISNAGGKIASVWESLCEKFGKRNALIGAGTAVVVLIIIVIGIRACTTPADPVQQALGDAERAVSTSSYANDDGSKPIQSTLVNLIGSEEAANLLDAASSNEDVYWIASHPDSFLADGDAVQAKLLKLAANEPEAASFVRNWPDEYPQDAPSGDASTPSADSGTSIPRLYQWDKRWGYTVYSSTTFALTGCCPTSLAMVYQGLTGNTDKSPYDMGQLARNGGYETQYDGTDGTFLLETADQLGLSCTQLTPIASNITSTLSAGKMLIINVGPGDFTTSGHYIVACGLNDDGKVIINDPYSAKRSEKTWDVNTLVDQAKAIYAYSA